MICQATGLIEIMIRLQPVSSLRSCFFMVAAILKLLVIVSLPISIVTQLMGAVAPVIGIISIPRGVLKIPRVEPTFFVSRVIVVTEIVVMGTSPDEERQENGIDIQNNARSIIVAMVSVGWLLIIERRKHYTTTGKLIVPSPL